MTKQLKSPVFDPGTIKIAGKKTIYDWEQLRAHLVPNGTAGRWPEAFRDFFRQRLSVRYIKPVEVLRKNDTLAGEGFSILAIHCSLIEFLESTVQGKSYRYRRKTDPPLRADEYSESGKMFTSFLGKRDPFKGVFDDALAKEFYTNVRCALLHEARTKGRWRIRVKGPKGSLIDAAEKIVFRDGFHQGILDFIDSYEQDLVSNAALQEAFIRKFDGLCQ